MGFLPEGDEVLWKKWKRQKQLDRLPAHVRAAMTPEEVHAFLYQDIPRTAQSNRAASQSVQVVLERMQTRLAELEGRLDEPVMANRLPAPDAPERSPARNASWLRRLFGRS